jgi:Kelch motif protein
MSLRGSYAGIMSLALLVSACGGGGGGGGQQPPPPPQSQTIVFATAGPVNGSVGTTVTNIASGGAGTGAITYSSGTTTVATVNATTGVATLVGTGSATITASKAASSGFTSATATYQLQVTPGTQAIAFAQNGSVNAALGSTTNNAASGGAGTGAITYLSSNTGVVTVNATTGAATAVGLGSATITATKAADANYNLAQALYTLNSQSSDSVHAWVGELSSQVFLPSTANTKQFGRARVADCALLADDLASCANVELNAVNAAPITDTKATLTTPAYYSIVDGTNIGEPIVANVQKFKQRILHGTVFFKDRYWMIGGAIPTLPQTTQALIHVPQSDIWSSSDGRTWRLETANAAFGTRWIHKTLVYDNAIWLLSGVRADGSGANEVWKSLDGVNWTPVTQVTPWGAIGFVPSMAATVFNGQMWVVISGRTYSSSDGANWTAQSAANAIGGGIPREYASFTSYNNKLWYIGGAAVFLVSPGSPATFNRVAQNDVWSSNDGITWTQVTATAPFAARQQHAAFVLGNKLWVFGGQRFNGSTAGPPPNDAWTTTDGVNWTQAALDTFMVNSWLQGLVQETNRVTFIGGVLRSYSNAVWQTTNGESWTELAPFDFHPNIVSRGVDFNGAIWMIGGNRADAFDTNEVWRSYDGLTWMQVITQGPIFSPRDTHRVLVFNNRLWVLGGWDFFISDGGTETLNNEVWSSADGVNWTKHTPIGTSWSPRAGHDAVVFNGRMWVIGGSDKVTQYNDVWSSADGVNWVLEKDHANFSERNLHTVVALDNALWLFAGSATSPAVTPSVGLQDAWKSTNGRDWTPLPTPPFAARLEQATAVLNGRIYLVAGWSSSDFFGKTRYNDVWSTADGETWQPETPAAPFSGRGSPALITHDNQLYLIGGFGISRCHDVWRSNDGAHWSAAFNHPITPP